MHLLKQGYKLRVFPCFQFKSSVKCQNFDDSILFFSVPSHRIKDALPREVIEKIKSSSVKSRAIAIIEPVVDGCRTTNETFNQLNRSATNPILLHWFFCISENFFQNTQITTRYQMKAKDIIFPMTPHESLWVKRFRHHSPAKLGIFPK